MTAQQEAYAIMKLMPKTYQRGVFYQTNYNGNEIKIAMKRSPKGLFLHVLRPCALVLKDESGNEINRRSDFRHYRIEIGKQNALWNEV